MIRVTHKELRKQYEDYLAEFDPTPIYYGDDYCSPFDYDDFVDEFYPPETYELHETTNSSNCAD